MFKELCGEKGLPSVVLATTMWSKVSELEGSWYEEELKAPGGFWRDMIRHGSAVFRYDDTHESALNIISYVLNLGRTNAPRLQRQMPLSLEPENKSYPCTKLYPGTTAYTYATLNPSSRSIRLLELQLDAVSDMIDCKLHTVSLTECSSYVALSYTWVSPSTLMAILLDGKRFFVRENL